MLNFSLCTQFNMEGLAVFTFLKFIVLLYITLVPYHRRERSEDDYLIHSLDRKSGVKLF